MLGRLRSLARRALGVRRTSTHYLPWLTRPGLECVVLVNNIESRFTSGRPATASSRSARRASTLTSTSRSSTPESYRATHGRHEFVEHHPAWTRTALTADCPRLTPRSRWPHAGELVLFDHLFTYFK